jgi:hypothetical protein
LHLLDEVAQQAGAVIFPGFESGRNPGRKRGFKVIWLGTLTVRHRVGSALELLGRAAAQSRIRFLGWLLEPLPFLELSFCRKGGGNQRDGLSVMG